MPSCSRISPLCATLLPLAISAVPLNARAWTPISSNQAIPVQSALITGDAPATEPVRIALSLSLRNPAQLDQFITALKTPGSPAYGQFLSSQQFMDQYAPTAAQAQTVVDYLTAAGFTNVNLFPGRSLITASGTVGVAQKAFNTRIVDFVSGAKRQYANVTRAQVPDALSGLVLSVAGLHNIQVMHLHSHRLPATSDPVMRRAGASAKATPAAGAAVSHSGYTGPQFQIAYDAGGAPSGSRSTIGIVTEGDDLSTVISDLRTAELLNGQPVVPVTVVQVNPIPNPVDTSGDGEWDLDSQSSTGIADNLKQLIFYNTDTLDDSSLVPAVQRFADDNIAQIGNQSYGGCEDLEAGAGSAALGSDLAGFEAAFKKAVAQGQTWFASTGDAGSTCGVPAAPLPNTGYPVGVPNAEYPSSSPNNVAAGGTTLSTDANYNYVSETSWIGGGGGISNLFAAPQWQIDSGAVPSGTAAIAATGTGRGTPDVAMSADPSSGLSTVVGGARETIGGTSLSSPLSAGSYARLQTAHCNTLGFGAPQFYALDTTKGLMSTATGFTDVTSGSNGTYVATTGWDYNTGFGSFDIAKAAAALPGAACPANANPIAELSADTVSGKAPLTVNFTGAGSSDPDGDAISYYIIDFGDGGNPVIQTTPVFAPHVYAAPGTYTVTETVRDSMGNVSLPVSLNVSPYGTPVGCVAPGQTMLTSPAGVSFGVQGMDAFSGQDDLLSTSFAEPANLSNKLVVTMKVNNLTGGPTTGLRWVTYFNVPENSNNYYVAMVTADGASPVYNYGIHTFTDATATTLTSYMYLGDLDASSTNTVDGTITLVLDKAAIGLKTGDVLSDIVSSVRTSAPDDTSGTTSAGVGLTQDSGSATTGFTLVGNDVCAADIANPPTGPAAGTPTGPTTVGGVGGVAGGSTSSSASGSNARLGGGAFGLALVPLLLAAGLRRRRRPE